MKNSAPIKSTATALADRLAGVADELHLRALRVLERDELSVGEVASVFQTPQSTISRRLKLLADAGWLQKRTVGPATLYSLSLDDLSDAHRAIWIAARAQISGDATCEEDDRRRQAVLNKRQADSLAYFGRVAGEWDQVRSELFGDNFTAAALLAMLDPDWIVADIGCGTGNAAALLAPHVARVIAIDQSDAMLTAVRKRLAHRANIEVRAGAIEALPLDDESVDAITCVLVLHHLENPAHALSQMARALKPRGVALILDMVGHDHAEFRRTMGHKRLGFDEGDMRSFLQDAGFERVRLTRVPSSPQARGPGLFVATGRKSAQ